MPEMELFIKPVFAKETIDKFTNDVEKGIGKGGGGSSSVVSTSDDSKKEQQRQTDLLGQISKFTKMSASAGLIATGLSMLPGAFNTGKNIADTRELRLERAFRGGENYSDETADAIESGQDLNEVLTQEMVIQEGLDQARRQATAELEGNTTAAEDAAKTLDDLRATYVDLGGNIDDFNEKVSTLGAKAWVDGELTKDELDKIDESFYGTKEKISEVAEGANDFANDTETSMQDLDKEINDNFDKTLDNLQVKLESLPSAFEELPLIKKFQKVLDIVEKIKDKIDAIKDSKISVGFGGGGGGGLDTKKSGDGVR